MKKREKVVLVLAVMMVCLLDSCVSLKARQMTSEERSSAEVIGTVTTSWLSYQFIHIPPFKSALENKAISELKQEAQKQGYKGNIEIRNISVAGSFTGWALAYPVSPLFGNFQKVTASGDVVSYNSATGSNNANRQRLQSAIGTVAEDLVTVLPGKSTIAVLNVSSIDRQSSEFTVGELEFALVRANKFIIVDRARLDQIRSERNFQLSGEVSNDSAVSVGNMLGANIVLVGEITAEGSINRLTIRALDVKTAQIIAMAREQF